MDKDIFMKNEIINTKSVCLGLGIILAGLTVFDYLLIFPSCILLIIGGILSFEITKKRKKIFEDHISYKIEKYEEIQQQMKKDYDKIKTEVESIRLRQGVSSVYGKQV